MSALQAAQYTQCPGCLTVFRIDARHLLAAAGRVRCGLCGECFDAGRTLSQLLPEDLSAQPAPPEPPEPELPGPELAGVEPPESEFEPVVPDVILPRASEPDWHYATALDVESRAARRQTPSRRWPWVLGCLLALAVLGGQWLWFERDALALDPAWRPWIASLCSVAGCELPPVRRPARIAVVARTLREHPQQSDGLLFTATLVNRADAAQRWPQLGLTLLGVDGRVLGRRWFTAREYLVDGMMRSEPMPPNRPVAVRLELRDPGAGAVGFEIAFR